MLLTRPLAVAALTVSVGSLGVMLFLWERRRRRRRFNTDGTMTMSSPSSTSGLSSTASPMPSAAPTALAAVADVRQKHICPLDDATVDEQSECKELASNCSTGHTDVTSSRQLVTDLRTDVDVTVSPDQEEFCVPKSVEQFSSSPETVQPGEDNLTGSHCMPGNRALAEVSLESLTCDSDAFSSDEVISSPKEQAVAEGALNEIACEKIVDSSAISSTQEDSPTNASGECSYGDFKPSLVREQGGDSISVNAGTICNSVPVGSPSNDKGNLAIADEKCIPTNVDELHVTVSSASSIQPYCADTTAFDAAYDQEVAEYVRHDSSSINFASSSTVTASNDALSFVTNSPELVNDIKTVMTPVQDSVSRQSNSELRSGDARQNGNERVFKFYLPTAMCGLFIGKKGRNVNRLKAKSGAYIHVDALPTARDMHLCVVKGTDAAVTKAIDAILERFPQLESELNSRLCPISVESSPSAVDVSHLQLQLVPHAPVSVLLSCVAESTKVFVQLPTHPTFTSLERVYADLFEVYSGAAAGELPPLLKEPVMPGSLCAVEFAGMWHRAVVIQQPDPCAGDGICQLRYLDYGGYDLVPLTRIRQLRPDFLTLPFQAVECSLAHVKPLPGADSLGESNAVATLASFFGRVLECINIGPDCDTGLPSVQLYADNYGVVVYVNQLVSGTGGMEWLSNENATY